MIYDSDEYIKQINKTSLLDDVRNLLIKENKNYNINFNYQNKLYEIQIEKIQITLYTNMNLKDFKLTLYKLENRDNICVLCTEEIIKSTHCSKCSFNYCIQCYINIFKTNKGIIKCPQCNFKYGNIISNELIGYYIDTIKLKAGLIK
jgi:hypothetical protein